MDSDLTPAIAEITGVPACAVCKQPAADPRSATPLCAECREELTRLKIPNWIKGFAGGIGVLFLFSLINMPRALGPALHLEKGKNAIERKEYATAEKELRMVLANMPYQAQAKAYLVIADFYNEKIDSIRGLLGSLENADLKDAALVSRLESVLQKAVDYYRSDSLETLLKSYGSLNMVPDAAWIAYFSRNKDDIFARSGYAQVLRDRNEFKTADSVLNVVLDNHPDNLLALGQQASLKREMRDFNGALNRADQILALNHQSVDGLAAKSRILLCMHQDEKGLKWARQAYALDGQNVYAACSLILAYHYNHKIAERDALIQQARKSSADSNRFSVIQYALDVIGDKEKFRD